MAVGRGVSLGFTVDVGIGVRVGVNVFVTVGVGVIVGVWLAVGVCVFVSVGNGVRVEVVVGVTLGVISQPRGLVLIDAPPSPEDSRMWRASLMGMVNGPERVLVNLDSHPDRTLGARAMDCTVIAHEKTAFAFRNRPNTFKAQGDETGANWEAIPGLGSVRWAPPEISFVDQLSLHWGETPILLESHPGPTKGAIWAILPEQKIIFVGDAIEDHLANLVIAQLLFLDSEDPEKDISLYINSPGGVVNSGLAIYDTMQYLRAPVSTICIGMAASMAAVLLAAGAKGKRYALPNSRIMIHQGSGGFRGNAPDAVIQMKEWEFLVNRNIEILARHTSQPVEKVRTDTNRDLFMAPEDAKDYGIIDAVYSEQWDSLTAQHHDEKVAEAAVEAGETEKAPEPKRSKNDPAG